MKKTIIRRMKIILAALVVLCVCCGHIDVLAATAVEPGTGSGTARKLKFNTEYAVKMSKNSYRHYYSFTLDKPGGVSVTITHKNKNISGNPIIMNLMMDYQDGLAPLTTIVRSNDQTSTSRVLPLTAGTHKILVCGTDLAKSGLDYTIKLNYTSADSVDANGDSLKLGKSKLGVFEDMGTSYVKMYKVKVSQTGYLKVKMNYLADKKLTQNDFISVGVVPEKDVSKIGSYAMYESFHKLDPAKSSYTYEKLGVKKGTYYVCLYMSRTAIMNYHGYYKIIPTFVKDKNFIPNLPMGSSAFTLKLGRTYKANTADGDKCLNFKLSKKTKIKITYTYKKCGNTKGKGSVLAVSTECKGYTQFQDSFTSDRSKSGTSTMVLTLPKGTHRITIDPKSIQKYTDYTIRIDKK